MPASDRFRRLALPCKPVAGVAIALALLMAGGTARANDYDDIDRLLRARNPMAALARVDQALAERPRDPQLRFMRAVALADAGRTSEALELLQRLTQDYPELPEPHNNLAVIHAASGDLDRAHAALQTALRLNPDYAAALDNLGDVQARLALRSWARAQQLEPALGSRITAKSTRVREAVAPPSPDARSGALRPASPGSATLPNARP